MKKLIIIFFASFLFGVNLINVNFFEQNKKLDILLSLEGIFRGKVVKDSKNKFFISNINSNKEYKKSFSNYFVKNIAVTPSKDGILISIDANKKYKTSVSLTPDGYGVRFRITNITKKIVQKPQQITYAQDSGIDYMSYFIAVAILIILAIILWIFKKKLKTKLPVKGNLDIVFQRALDPKNKIALIEFNKRKYLVIIGNSNILLDIFDENMINIKTQNEFEEYLQKDDINKKLDSFQKYIKNAEKLKDFDERI